MRRKFNYIKPFVIVAMVFAVAVIWVSSDKLLNDFSFIVPDSYSETNNFSYSVTIQNQTPRNIKNANVSLYMSVSNSQYYETFGIKTGEPSRTFKDGLGNQVLYLDLEEFQAKSSRILTFTGSIGVLENSIKIDEHYLHQYLVDDPVLRINSKEVLDIVDSFEKKDKLKIVIEILSWIESNGNIIDTGVDETLNDNEAEHPDPKMDISVPEIMKKNIRGEISDAYIFLALSRAAGIPARMIVGVEKNTQKKYSIEEIIMWVEYFEKGVWYSLDAKNLKPMEKKLDYIAFRIISEFPQQLLDSAYQYLYESSGVDVIPGSLSIQFN